MAVASQHPIVHALLYGDSGAGKSTCAATFPKPLLLFQFDPYGKETPYLAVGNPTELYSDERADFCRDVRSRKTDATLIRIEYYHDSVFTEPELIQRKARVGIKDMEPDSYHRFLRRMAKIHTEYDTWRTIVIDSVTFMEIAARKWDQYVLNPRAEDGRQWYGAATEFLEQMLMQRFAGIPVNVVVICHVDHEKDEMNGTFLRMPAAPGRLRGRLPTAFTEFYRVFIDGDGGHVLQTQPDKLWAATTRINAPNLCPPNYHALWQS